MQQFMDYLKKIPAKGNLVAALILFLLVWFILPHIAIGGTRPFASSGTRILVLGLFGLAWLIKLMIQQIQTHKEKTLTLFLEKSRWFYAALKHALRHVWYAGKRNIHELKYRATQDRNRRRLRRLPWYLVIGAPQSGKKSAITNMGLYFAQPKHFGEEAENYIKQFPDFDWWFSEQAVLIDILNHVKDDDHASWKKYIKLLKRERKRKPVNGIILTFSMADILLYSNQKRQEFIQDICLYIRNIHDTFKAQVPVYLVLTKCDQVEGFMEFFSDLSKDESHQVWGMTIPLAECDDMNKALSFFSNEYTALLNQLRNQVLWALDSERNPRGRELIHSFPQQMRLFKRPLENFITELFSAVRYPKALQLRGLYFTSSKQEGEPIDFLLQAMSKKFQLVPPAVQRPQRMGECYFLRRLFYDVIYPEAQLLGDSERSKKLRQWTYYSARIASPVLIVLLITGMHAGYQQNIADLKQVEQNLEQYQQLKLKMNASSDSLTDMLPLLDQLQRSAQRYRTQLPLGMRMLYETGAIYRGVNSAMNRVLSNLFMPRVAAQIENQLNQNIQDQNLLYATLKGYLAFSANDSTSSDAIRAPMEYDWNQNFTHDPDMIKQLRYYLNLALKQLVEKLPLDGQLISRIRGQLEAIIPSKRAYGLLQLKASVGDLAPLILSSAVGGHFQEVFSSADQTLAIPALYTRTGFNTIFLSQYKSIAEEVSQDNQDIGLSQDNYEIQTTQQIITAMQETYQERYTAHWDKALNNLDIVKFDNLTQAIHVLNLLVSKQSPLAKLFTTIYNNTNTIQEEKIQVDKAFSPLNHFSSGDAWQQTQNILTQIRDYLLQIQQSPDVDKAEYDAAVATIQGSKSPIQDLSRLAQKAPQPVRKWLLSIADHSWNVVVQGAHKHLNTLWQTDVMGEYKANIQGRYPLDPQSDSQILMSSFNQFFGLDGTLDQYFHKYLKPFIQTDTPSWQAYVIEGHSIELPAQHIAIFQRAASIQKNYFPDKSHSAHLALAIKPLTLDANASSISFTAGNHSIHYSHGPQNLTNIDWPFTADNQDTEIILSTFGGGQYAKSASGPWSLFKILDAGEFRQIHSGSYIYGVSLHGYRASFEISGSGDSNLYRLSQLKNFALPQQIAPDQAMR